MTRPKTWNFSSRVSKDHCTVQVSSIIINENVRPYCILWQSMLRVDTVLNMCSYHWGVQLRRKRRCKWPGKPTGIFRAVDQNCARPKNLFCLAFAAWVLIFLILHLVVCSSSGTDFNERLICLNSSLFPVPIMSRMPDPADPVPYFLKPRDARHLTAFFLNMLLA